MDIPERLHVLHVLAPAAFGGAEAVVRGLVEGLSLRDLAVGAVVLLEGEAPHPYERTLAESGAVVLPVRLPPHSYRAEARALAEIFRRNRPDIVHTHGFRADIQGGRVAGRLGIPRVSTVHGFTGGDARIKLYEWLQVRALKRFEAVIAVSQLLTAQLVRRGVHRERVHVLRNSWCGGLPGLERTQARLELGLPSDAFVVGWVGRLSAEKGGDLLIEALARVRDLPLVTCVIGDGPERSALESRARRHELAHGVRWCGIRADAGRLFRAFDAFVLSSRTEGTPIVLLEAMQAGVPVVATAVGGVPDVVGPGEAWLVAPGDPGAIAGALRELHADAAGAARRAEAARRRLDVDFIPGPWLDAHERIYREVKRTAHQSAALELENSRREIQQPAAARRTSHQGRNTRPLIGRNLLKRLVFALPEPLVNSLRKARALEVVRNFSEDEEPDLRVVKQLVAPGDTVLDIGANIGCYTHILSECVGPEGRVHSVEPIPITYEILSNVVRRLGLGNVELHNCAVFDVEGRANMEVPPYEIGGMNLYQARLSASGTEASPLRFEVDLSKIDSLFANVESISFVKVDVEGVELACMRGARDTLVRAHPAWLIEVSGNPDDATSDASRLFDLLWGEGYAAFWYDGAVLHRRRSGDRSVNYFFLTEQHVEGLRRGIEFV